jgi:uncharacterized protein (DUF2461 family)
MTIKYGELTIIKDTEQSILSSLLNWITNEEHKVKKAPKGIDPSHPDIELLKYTSYVVSAPIDNSELTSENLNKQIIKGLKTIQPFLDFLNTAME